MIELKLITALIVGWILGAMFGVYAAKGSGAGILFVAFLWLVCVGYLLGRLLF